MALRGHYKRINMPTKVTINAYKFEELDDKAKHKVLWWLDEHPLNYEDENGEIKWEYYNDIYDEDPSYIIEHCEANEYLFDEYGNAIHHLID